MKTIKLNGMKCCEMNWNLMRWIFIEILRFHFLSWNEEFLFRDRKWHEKLRNEVKWKESHHNTFWASFSNFNTSSTEISFKQQVFSTLKMKTQHQKRAKCCGTSGIVTSWQCILTSLQILLQPNYQNLRTGMAWSGYFTPPCMSQCLVEDKVVPFPSHTESLGLLPILLLPWKVLWSPKVVMPVLGGTTTWL